MGEKTGKNAIALAAILGVSVAVLGGGWFALERHYKQEAADRAETAQANANAQNALAAVHPVPAPLPLLDVATLNALGSAPKSHSPTKTTHQKTVDPQTDYSFDLADAGLPDVAVTVYDRAPTAWSVFLATSSAAPSQFGSVVLLDDETRPRAAIQTVWYRIADGALAGKLLYVTSDSSGNGTATVDTLDFVSRDDSEPEKRLALFLASHPQR